MRGGGTWTAGPCEARGKSSDTQDAMYGVRQLQNTGSWKLDPGEVRFLTKDLKSRSTVETCYTLEGFIERLGHQVPDRYTNNIRYFGLLAPRTKGRLYDFIFHLLGQHQRSKPRRLPWAAALMKYFGVNPLVDAEGHHMHWVGRLDPVSPAD